MLLSAAVLTFNAAAADEALPSPLDITADQDTPTVTFAVPTPPPTMPVTEAAAPPTAAAATDAEPSSDDFGGMRFVNLGRITFETGKWDLSGSARRALDTLASYLTLHPGATRLLLDASADWMGTAAYNDGLSDKRAVAVEGYLIGIGVDPQLIRWKGHGEHTPTDENWNRLGRGRNRQVELFAVYLP